MTHDITAVLRDGRHDPPVALDQVKAAQPAANEAVVEVRASTINRGELALLASRPDGWRPGQDLAGIVTHAAADGSGPPAGARVLGTVDGGAWASEVAAPGDRLAILPDGVPFPEAAAMGIAGLTALRVLRRAGSLLGRRTLVTGARGGVGHLIVELATLAGAEVTADDLDRGPFDLVLEGIGGRSLNGAVAALAPGGTVVLYGASDPEPARLTLLDFIGHENAQIVTFFSYAATDEDSSDLALLARLLSEGRITPRIGRTYRFADVAEAVTTLRERGVDGKIALTP